MADGNEEVALAERERDRDQRVARHQGYVSAVEACTYQRCDEAHKAAFTASFAEARQAAAADVKAIVGATDATKPE